MVNILKTMVRMTLKELKEGFLWYRVFKTLSFHCSGHEFDS